MRLVYLLLSLALIAATVGPFFLKGPDGAPLMTVDKVMEDNIPEPLRRTEAYRWQDDQGKWHFSDTAPGGSDTAPGGSDTATGGSDMVSSGSVITAGGNNVEQFTITPRHTALQRGWAGNPKSTSSAARPTGISLLDGARDLNPYDGKAIDRAKAAAEMMRQRNETLDALVDHSR